jgi:hypothetical protein
MEMPMTIGDSSGPFIDPHTVHHVFTADSGDVEETRIATRRQRMLRRLLEDTALLYGDLYADDAEYTRTQRSSLAKPFPTLIAPTASTTSPCRPCRWPENTRTSYRRPGPRR